MDAAFNEDEGGSDCGGERAVQKETSDKVGKKQKRKDETNESLTGVQFMGISVFLCIARKCNLAG